MNQQTVSRNTDLESVATGASLYRKNCVQYHGKDGVGAPNWHRPDPYVELGPRDFSHEHIVSRLRKLMIASEED